jgi:hypothetical protein
MSNAEAEPRFWRQRFNGTRWSILPDVQPLTIFGDCAGPLKVASHFGQARKQIGVTHRSQVVYGPSNALFRNH